MAAGIPKTVGPYQVIYPIGNGAFSSVYQGCNSATNKRVALKFIKRNILCDISTLKAIEKEIRLAERLCHKNIVKYFQTYFLTDYIVIAMECLGNGTVTNLIESALFHPDLQDCLRWGKDILEGIEYLHEKKISHHDIKPDNIGFDAFMNAKIMDLGLCEEFTDYCYSRGGTPLFKAPEVECCEKYDGTKSDIWSFGVTFHYIVTGSYPFINISDEECFKDFKSYSKNVINMCPKPLKIIVDLSLTINKRYRPSAKQLLSLDIFKGVNSRFNNESETDCIMKRSQLKPKSMKNIIISPLFNKKKALTKNSSDIRYSTVISRRK